jgi:hypothetical protein
VRLTGKSTIIIHDLGFGDVTAHQTVKKNINIQRFVERFPFEHLCATLERYTPEKGELDATDSGHTELEGRLLREYSTRYGDSPPLNG